MSEIEIESPLIDLEARTTMPAAASAASANDDDRDATAEQRRETLLAGAPAAQQTEPASPRGARRGRRMMRLLNVSDPGVLFGLVVFVNLPQIVATIVIFALERGADADVCDAGARARWRVWGAAHALRLLATTVVAGLRWRFDTDARQDAPELSLARQRAVALITNARNSLDCLALIWFVVGNMWLLGGADQSCHSATDSRIYVLDVSMLAVQYAQICLPCVFAIMMVPIFCFCLPCVIRLLATLHDPAQGRGASRRAIAELPTMAYTAGLELSGEEACCSVCISDYELGEQLRLLPCKHVFHKECVDQWLAVNANCPLCRKTIYADDQEPTRDPRHPHHALRQQHLRVPEDASVIEMP